MIVIFALHVLVPAGAVALLCAVRPSNRAAWVAAILAFAAYLTHVWVLGRWDVVGYGLRSALPAALAVGAAVSFLRTRSPGWSLRGGVGSGLAMAGSVVLGCTFATTAGIGLTGHRAPPDAVDLLFPIPDRVAYVGHGGSTSVINHHTAVEAQAHAVDLFLLNDRGGRATGLRPRANEAYAIWGARVVSPCTGMVSGRRNHIEDHPPGGRDLDSPEGNFLAIHCQGVTVILAHLQRGSITVRPGTWVHAGQLVGRVGNSGNSSEPHLHIHAERGGPRAFAGLAEGVPITFGGRYLVRNSLIL